MSRRQQLGVGRVLSKIFHTYGAIFGMAWEAARSRAAALFSLMLSLGIIGAFGALVSRSVVDGLAEGDRGKALLFGVIFLSIQGGSTLLNDLMQLLQVDMADRISHVVDQRMMRIAAGAPGLDHLERSEFADRMKQVRERVWLPSQMLQTMGSAMFVLFGILASIILLGQIHPILIALPFVMIPSAYIQFRAYRKHWAMFDKAVPEQRLAEHYLKLATSPTGAKEIRLFGLRGHILSEHRRLSDAFVRLMFRARLKQAAGSTFGGILYGLALTGSIAFIGTLALRGQATLGEVAMGVQLTRLMLGHVEMAAELVAGLTEGAFMGEKYLWLLHYEPALTVAERPLPAPRAIGHGITFENVTFAYPGTEKQVLRDISLHLPAAATVALVGENGAG
ncbi:MAG TPA: ABC transporter ATP-binding protein, partial [Actinomycetota bacterium]|nr:ABC transporter ATP-binding protein [Actinomycetota bacterium]